MAPVFTVSRRGIENALTSINADPVQHLINTHWHTDHTDGNAWLGDGGAVITAHENTRRRERDAANVIVESVGNPNGGGPGRGPGGGGPGGGGGGGGRGAAPTGPQLPEEMNAEFTILSGKHKTILEIRDFLSGEFTPLPLADLMTVLKAREAAGMIKLIPKSAK